MKTIVLTILLLLIYSNIEVVLEESTHVKLDVRSEAFDITKVTMREVCFIQNSFPNGTFENCVSRELFMYWVEAYNGKFI